MPFKDLQEELNYLQSKAILSDIIEHLENARNFVLFMFITISAIDSSTDRTVDMLLTLRYTIAAALYLKKVVDSASHYGHAWYGLRNLLLW